MAPLGIKCGIRALYLFATTRIRIILYFCGTETSVFIEISKVIDLLYLIMQVDEHRAVNRYTRKSHSRSYYPSKS